MAPCDLKGGKTSAGSQTLALSMPASEVGDDLEQDLEVPVAHRQ